MRSSLSFFSGLRDPRVERTKAHRLEDILFIAIVGKEAGYILALKENQGNLLQQTKDSFDFLEAGSASEIIIEFE